MTGNRDNDLRRMIEAQQIPGRQQKVGSGLVIGMPDGKGGQKQVPVELATVLILDNIHGLLSEVRDMLKADIQLRGQMNTVTNVLNVPEVGERE